MSGRFRVRVKWSDLSEHWVALSAAKSGGLNLTPHIAEAYTCSEASAELIACRARTACNGASVHIEAVSGAEAIIMAEAGPHA